jgi:hypothetical protein
VLASEERAVITERGCHSDSLSPHEKLPQHDLTGCCSNAFLQRFDARDPSLRSGRHLKALFLVVILNEVKNLDFEF